MGFKTDREIVSTLIPITNSSRGSDVRATMCTMHHPTPRLLNTCAFVSQVQLHAAR